MKQTAKFIKFTIVMGIILTIASLAIAQQQVKMDDIFGKWDCGIVGKYSFNRDHIYGELAGANNTFVIKNIINIDNGLIIETDSTRYHIKSVSDGNMVLNFSSKDFVCMKVK